MDKIWEQTLKHLPAETVPAILAIGLAFFGVYYAKGLRSYTDALSDRLFLTAAVVIAAVTLVLWIQRPRDAPVASDERIALIVPRFERDDQRQLEALFAQQVQAALHSFSKDAAVVRLDAYLEDRKSAELTATSRGALAVLYQPRVVRSEGKDGRVFICFSLLTVEPQSSKVYPPKPPELDKATLDDLSGALTAALTRSGQKLNDPVVARTRNLGTAGRRAGSSGLQDKCADQSPSHASLLSYQPRGGRGA